jgi:LuxR family maltose regulon positive regulatory protein
MAAAAYPPLLKARISIPPVREQVVPRPHLLARLDASLTRPFTLISAPAGFGKTTLLTQWIASVGSRARVAWLSLDEADHDPVHFLYYLAAALQELEPRIARTPMSLLGGMRVPAPKDLITLLLSEINDIDSQIVLVLDDYHIVDSPEVDAALAFFVERLPRPMHLVMSSREEPRLPLARWRSLEKFSEIGADDLRFSGDEADEFLQRTMGLELDADLVRMLESRTEGWIAGLQMAALTVRHHARTGGSDPAHTVASFSGEHRYIIDYLAGEVMSEQTPETQAFLRKTAVLFRLCAPLCDAVTGRSDSKEVLESLERANMFLRPLDDRREWYRYHSLFADFLRRGADAEAERAVHVTASEWYEAHGMGREAMRHALTAKDIPSIIRLFRSVAESMLAMGEIHTLLGWLDALPEATIRAHADLSVYKAWLLYLRGQSVEAQSYAKPLREPVASEGPHDGTQAAFQAYLALNWGEPRDAIPMAEQALARTADKPSFFRVYAMNLLGQAQVLCGQRKDAGATLRQAFQLAQKLDNHLMTLDALSHLALLMYSQGQLREAILLCRNTLERYVDDQGRPQPVAGLAHIPLGIFFYENNDLESARYCLVTGIALCQQVGMVYFRLMGQRALAKLQHVSGEREAAWNTLAAAREVAAQPESPRRGRLVAALTAEIQLREGNVSEAARTLAAAHSLQGPPSEYEALTQARLLLAQHHPSRAAITLDRLERLARNDGCDGSLVGIFVLQSLCFLATNERKKALERLERAVSLAASAGYRRVFLDEGAPVLAMLEELRHVAPEFVNGLLEPISGAPAVPTALPDPLSKSEREILRLLNRGMTNQEIADQLAITVGTTKWHLNRIFAKLSVRNRTEAISKGRHLKLV